MTTMSDPQATAARMPGTSRPAARCGRVDFPGPVVRTTGPGGCGWGRMAPAPETAPGETKAAMEPSLAAALASHDPGRPPIRGQASPTPGPAARLLAASLTWR